MAQAQSIIILLALVALAFSPLLLARARRKDREDERPMTGQEAVARHLYGEVYRWAPDAMRDYDCLPAVREPWLAEAEHRLTPKDSQHVA
jgi:hypothetical protein